MATSPPPALKLPTMNLTISDPATAIAVAALNALQAWFQFLATPEGQKVSEDVRKLTWDPLVALIPKPKS